MNGFPAFFFGNARKKLQDQHTFHKLFTILSECKVISYNAHKEMTSQGIKLDAMIGYKKVRRIER